MPDNDCHKPWYLLRGNAGEAYITRKDVLRWRLALQAVDTFKISVESPIVLDVDRCTLISEAAGLHVASLVSGDSLVKKTPLAFGAFYACMFIYGLPHILGWNAHFATSIERVLWRTANLALPVLALSIMVHLGVYVLVCHVLLKMANVSASRLEIELHIVGKYTVVFYLITYVVASGIMISESIRQLLVLTPDVFKQPSFASYWPHFA